MGLNSPCFLDTHHSPDKFVHIPPLLRDLPGDLVGPHGIVIRLLAKPEVVPQVDQGQRDPKPHAEQGHHGRERHLEITRSHKKSSSSALETEVTGQPNSLHRHPHERGAVKLPNSPPTRLPLQQTPRMEEVPTAPEECFPQMKQFRTKQIPKTTPGYKVAVCKSKRRVRENTRH